jgi:ribosomal protein S6
MKNSQNSDGKRMYEGMFILKASAASKDWNRTTGEVKKLLESHGAEIVSYEKWDERKLTYEIRKQNKGVYVLSYYLMPPGEVASLKKEVGLSNLILRLHMIRSSGPAREEEDEAEKAQAAAEPVQEAAGGTSSKEDETPPKEEEAQDAPKTEAEPEEEPEETGRDTEELEPITPEEA